jgi:hypothetical protein
MKRRDGNMLLERLLVSSTRSLSKSSARETTDCADFRRKDISGLVGEIHRD